MRTLLDQPGAPVLRCAAMLDGNTQVTVRQRQFERAGRSPRQVGRLAAWSLPVCVATGRASRPVSWCRRPTDMVTATGGAARPSST